MKDLASANEHFLKDGKEVGGGRDNAQKHDKITLEKKDGGEPFEILHASGHVKKKSPVPKRHVAFLKVHKTASSTAQNVFLRYGDERNLSFVLAHTKGESTWLNVISYVNSITKDNIVPAPKGQPFDILCCHVIYDRQSFEAVLPRDTAYVGIVRDPVSRFQSAVKYFSPRFILKLPGENPLSVYADNPLAHEPENPRLSQTNNRMAVEFGFPADLFPGKPLNGSQSEIDAYLKKLDSEFDFIIISEKFDESMILMKRILGWDTKDVLYVDKNVGGKITNTRKILQNADKSKIKQFLRLDSALYDFALKRFNKLVSEGGDDFISEVAEFKAERKQVNHFCTSSKDNEMHIGATEWHDEYTVRKYDCKTFSKHEKDLIQKQRLRMYGTLDN